MLIGEAFGDPRRGTALDWHRINVSEQVEGNRPPVGGDVDIHPAPFIDGKLFREFGDAADLTVRSGTLSSTLVDAKRGTWGRLEAGIGGGAGGGPLPSAFVDLGDVRGWGLRGGFRF